MRTPLLVAIAILVAVPVARAADPVATVGGKPISRADLEEHVRPKLVEIENERYEALREGLDEMVAVELFAQEAKSRGVTVEKLEEVEVTAKVVAPTDAEIQQVYDANKQQLGGATLDQVKPRIVEFLKGQKEEARRQSFVQELKAKHKTVVNLDPPRVKIDIAGRPARGNPSAPVTIVEFSDYECPFCKRAEAAVDQVVKAYPDKVRLVFVNFPLSFHASAKPAAEAALCANTQGKFWDYSKKLFESPDLTADRFKTIAKDTGLDQAKFDQCLAKKETAAAVDKDIKIGAEAGVTGTPAFFINGRMISGAQPFEKFKEIIDEELARGTAGTKS